MSHRVHIIGAGLAGLHCAATLRQTGVDVVVHERSDAVGGRMRTDTLNGFVLDRGFHVMQSGYELAASRVDFTELQAQPFSSGARVIKLVDGSPRMVTYADPFRSPFTALASLKAGNWADIARVARLRHSLLRCDAAEVFSNGDDTTESYLRSLEFSAPFVNSFFRPLFSGIFLESGLATSERMFRFVFRAMARGQMLLPQAGIKAWPEKIAASIGTERINLGVSAHALSPHALNVEGSHQDAAQVIVAHPDDGAGDRRSVWTLYFDAPRSPIPGGYLVLNGDYALGMNLIAHLAVPSDIQPSYAAAGRSLVAVTVVGDAALAMGLVDAEDVANRVRSELAAWFPQSSQWGLLAARKISSALPVREAGSGIKADMTCAPSSIIHCGDHSFHGSVEGAIQSAEAAAAECVARLARA